MHLRLWPRLRAQKAAEAGGRSRVCPEFKGEGGKAHPRLPAQQEAVQMKDISGDVM